MNKHSLLNNVEARSVNAPVAAGSSIDDNSSRVDMAGLNSALFMVPIDDSVATGVATLTIEGNAVDSDTGMTAIADAVATATCAVNDDLNGKMLIVEVRNPGYRYVQAVVTSATANIAFGTTIALLSPRTVPVTQGNTVAASTLVSD